MIAAALTGWRDRLNARLDALDLGRKITLALLSGALLLGAMVALPAFFLARHQLMANTQFALEGRAHQERQEIQLRVISDIRLAESLASNSITANALADSVGRDIYLLPLLKAQQFLVPGAHLALTDYLGRTVAHNAPHGTPSFENVPAFQRMMQSSKLESFLRSNQDGDPSMVMFLPVIYRLTGNVEGAVVLCIPLKKLLPVAKHADLSYITDIRGQLLAGNPSPKDALKVSLAMELPAPLNQLGLVHTLARDRDIALRDLNWLIAVFMAVGLIMSWGVVWAARRASKWLTTPLGNLAAASESIAATGSLQSLAPMSGQDELARLTRSFNQMVERLRGSYSELEWRVEERTAALASSERRLQYVMDATGEGVWDWDLRLGQVHHNARWCKMLGLDATFLAHDFSDITRLLHPEDISRVKEVIQACLEQGAPYVSEHRMVRTDGSIIWVLDRGKVVERDDSGRPARMVGSLINITDSKLASEQVRVRELYLRATVDNLPFLFWLKDAECRFLTVNKQFAAACGRGDPDQVVGLTDLDVWPQDLAELYRADDLAVLASRQDKAVEEPVETDGQRHWIETYKKPVINSDGVVLGTVGFARDITARKETEQALEMSEQRWQLAVTGSKDGIWDWDIPSGKVFFSDRWKEMLGYGPEELAGAYEEWAGMVHPDDLSRVEAEIWRHMNKETDFFQSEFRMRHKTDGEKWILSRGRALFDPAGKVIRMTGSHTDITERRYADEALRDRNEQLDAIFALSPDGFISFDRNRRIKYANDAFLRMTGLETNVIVGLEEQDFEDLLQDRCNPAMAFPCFDRLREDLGHATTQKPLRRLIELTVPTRRVLDIGLRQSQAITVSQILYCRDVTYETAVDQMKSEFLSTAAHELRTPMASILGFSELLLSKDFDAPTRRDLLDTIHTQSELMASILNELLDLARIEARRGKDFVLEFLELDEIIKLAAASYSPPKGRHAPVLTFDYGPTYIRADRKKMLQVITNILSNAYKYSPKGGNVRISSLPLECIENQWMVGFQVEDEGIGLTPDQLERVFERFYRADTSGKISGTGLGMSIVKEIVELHQGRVDITSQVGVGTKVDVRLPIMTMKS